MKKINNIDNPILWDENFIQNFKIENPSKKIGIIKWNQDENRMRLQLLSCIRNEVDVILSEVVPGDFKDNLLNSEFEYFCEHYLYIPPKVPKSNKKVIKNNSILIITDESYNNKLVCNTVISVLDNLNINIIQINDNFCLYDKLKEKLLESEKIVINCRNPNIMLYSIIYSIINDKYLMIDNIEKVASRLWASGITNFEIRKTVFEDDNLRSTIDKVLNLNTNFYITKENFCMQDFDLKVYNEYKLYTNSKYCKDFLYNFKYKRIDSIRHYSNIFYKHNTTNKKVDSYSRFKIFYLLNIAESSNINAKIKKIVLEKVLFYIMSFEWIKSINALFYELLNNYDHDIEKLIKSIINLIVSNKLTTTNAYFNCLKLAEVLYHSSLNETIFFEKRKIFYKSSILLLDFISDKNDEIKTDTRLLLEYLSMETKKQITYSYETINSILDTVKDHRTEFTSATFRIHSANYIEYIKTQKINSIHPCLKKTDPIFYKHNLIQAICYKIGLHPEALYFKPVTTIKKLPNILDELHMYLNLGFNSLHLLVLMRHELNWKQIEEKAAGLNHVYKSFLLLHCLDKPDLNLNNNDLYKNYIPDKSNYGLAIHFSIQILLAKFSNKNLDCTLVEKINAYIKTICPEQDEAAYSHAYFLASSVNHELLDQIFLQNQVNNSYFYRVNVFLDYLDNLAN